MIHPDNQTTNGQRPFNARRDGESDYFEVNGRLGGTDAQPGIGIGPGSGPRDVQLYRDEADVWRTPDAFHVGELRVDSAGRTDSRTQLGLGTAATEDTGTASGDLALLSTSGAFATARIPNLPASKITSGSFNTARIPNLAASKITSGTFARARLPAMQVVTTLPTGATGDVAFYTGTTFSTFDSWDAGIAVPPGETVPLGVAVKANGDILIVGATTDRVYTYSGGSWDGGIAVPSGKLILRALRSKQMETF